MKQKFLLLAMTLIFTMTVSAKERSPTIPSICDPEKYEIAVRIIKYYETLHRDSWPYVGFGHRVQPNEKFKVNISYRQADSLLRSDLNKLLHYFNGYGDKALILSVLSYNVGLKPLVGGKGKPESRLLQKIKRGENDIEAEYLGFCHWNGKKVDSIKRRRWMELRLLYQLE
ncbi:hypothetical protein HMPREF1214_02086 [Bacteroides sp. HPS0048]|nr:hypothetical protein HMPREF1214_02086 [Bacteroides sp. HPS0048]